MKILYVTTISNTVNAFLLPHIRQLVEKGHQVDVACHIQQVLNPELLALDCHIHEIPFSRSPFSPSNLQAYRLLKQLVEDEDYYMIHTHTPIASMISRLVKRSVKDVKIVYTAHGFHFFKGAPLKNWIIYYTIEKWLSKYTDVLITINKEDFNRALIRFKNPAVEYINGIGLDTTKYRKKTDNREHLRNELGIKSKDIMLISVGELNSNKNHILIIKAMQILNSPKIHLVICGEGPLKATLQEEIIKHGQYEHVHLLGFRLDVIEWLSASDIFVFPSKREGLGMAALEAMAMGIPIITSNVHGIVDYSIDGISGYTCSPYDHVKLGKLIEQMSASELERNKFSRYNEKAVEKYNVEAVLAQMEAIYERASLNL